MKELKRHIEILLLRHDCVIVPDFGAFLIQYHPAEWDEATFRFYPPRREVKFTPFLRHNDGLLAGSYMEAHDTSFPQTLRLIAQSVKNVKEALERTGVCEMKGIGTLKYSLREGYTFEAEEAGALSPELYALDAVESPLLGAEAKAEEEVEEEVASNEKHRRLWRRTDEHYTLRIPRTAVNYVVAVASIVAFYFLLALPGTYNTTTPGECTASMPLPTTQQKAPSAVPTPSAPKVEEEKAIEKTPVIEKETPQATPETPQSIETPLPAQEEAREGFVIVLAAGVAKQNAEYFIHSLEKEGIEGAYVAKYKKHNYVYFSHYDTEEAAQNALLTLRTMNKAFKKAWVKKDSK